LSGVTKQPRLWVGDPAVIELSAIIRDRFGSLRLEVSDSLNSITCGSWTQLSSGAPIIRGRAGSLRMEVSEFTKQHRCWVEDPAVFGMPSIRGRAGSLRVEVKGSCLFHCQCVYNVLTLYFKCCVVWVVV